MSRARVAEALGLIAELRAAGAHLSADGGRLKVAAPEGLIGPDVARRISELKPEILAALDETEIPRADRSEPLPLGLVAERMWAHAQLEPQSAIYNLPAAWRFSGPLDAAALQRAFAAFVGRHEILRLRIVVRDGKPFQRFVPAPTAPLELEDLSGVEARLRDARLHERIEALRAHPFELESGDPYLARLFRLSDDDHALFFMPHHVAWDGWCFDLFLRDLREFYLAETEARAPRLPELPVQYADYALWHRRRIEGGAAECDIAYWSARLADPPPPPNLPEDRPRPDLFSAEGDWTDFEIDAPTLAAAKALGQSARATTFMTFLAIWRAFIARLSGAEDTIIGAPIQARERAEAAEIIGCFVNTVFLRQRVDPAMSLRAHLAETRDVCLEAYAHQQAPVDLLVDRLVPRRDPSRTPLAQAMFSHQQVSRRPDDFGAARLAQFHVNPRISPTDLMFAVMEGERAARAVIHYATGVFSPAQAQRLKESLAAFLRDALTRPDAAIADLALMSEETRRRLILEFNATDRRHAPPLRAHELIAATAKSAPDRIAVRAGGVATSYGALEARARRLAFWLNSQGVRAGDLVALMPQRNADMPALALAAWKCGAAYLPLDPAYPEERLRYMVSDSGAKLVVSTREIAALADPGAAMRVDLDACEAEIAAAPDDIAFSPDPLRSERAYVIYTSGSTGRPKGVENSHTALANFLRAIVETPGLGPDDRLLAVTTLAFDISILELFAPLVAGAECVIATAEEAGDGETLARMLRDENITVMQATPATWRLLLDAGFSGEPGLKALCGGEALAPALAAALLPKVGALWNMYGPTETTVWSAMKRIESPEAISIGRPMANTRLYVVGPGGSLAPPGANGELLIGGAGVAIGYLGRPDLTAERFIADPFRADGRVYRTGDLARMLEDGEVIHLGRMDAQVKLRGFRIELGEVEAALETHDAVQRAAAAIKTDAAGEPTLVAYFIPREGRAATGSELRRWLRRTLPNYMLPQLFLEIAAVPLTGSGKVDRNALPDPAARAVQRAARIAPRTDLEREIAAIWAEILGASEVSLGDNFFELGGQSLQAAQMAARVRERTGRRLSPRSVIFETLEQLAAGADAASATG